MARDEHRQLGRNNGENSGTSRGSNLPVKRKCLNYGPDSVETWAATEVSNNHCQTHFCLIKTDDLIGFSIMILLGVFVLD